MAMCGAVALAAVALVSPGSVCPAGAQSSETCTNSCKAAFGACYKHTANRSACEAQLQRCLQGCLTFRK
jgi:hypothetical protein